MSAEGKRKHKGRGRRGSDRSRRVVRVVRKRSRGKVEDGTDGCWQLEEKRNDSAEQKIRKRSRSKGRKA